jgi:N6-L-threonylcarbamoyladenine synthase
VDLIAVTTGPGLEPALWTGIVFGKDLAKKWKVPLIPVNHMEGHLLSVYGKEKGEFKVANLKSQMPMLALLVSGGHTEIVLMKEFLKYKILGATLDDAVGEAFDKVARMLGLPYPGGPEISKFAEKARASNEQHPFTLPRPMLKSKNYDFSFSGLKTAVLYLIRDLEKINEKTKAQIALEFENAAIETVVYKTVKAVEQYKVKILLVGGGVAANKHLRREIKKALGKKVKILFPTKHLSTDNSLMIGIAGFLNYLKNKRRAGRGANIKAIGNLSLK